MSISVITAEKKDYPPRKNGKILMDNVDVMTAPILEKKLRYDRICSTCRVHTVQVKKYIKAFKKECFVCKECGCIVTG